MSNIPDYSCTGCGLSKKRDELTVKKVVFLEMGAGARTKRSRVVDWLCNECLESDPTFIMPAFTPPKQVTHAIQKQ